MEVVGRRGGGGGSFHYGLWLCSRLTTSPAYSAFLNLALVAAGYLLVWSNRLRRNEKAGVVVLMALGILLVWASCISRLPPSMRD